MEKKTWIIILFIISAISISINIGCYHAFPVILETKDSNYDYMNIRWCEMSNKDNNVINSLIKQLRSYDEEYDNMPLAEYLDCGFAQVALEDEREYTEEEQNKISYAKTNYEGLIKLGLAPNSDPRMAREKDIDTGMRGKSNGYTFGLFESRTWEEGDYGKTFISPVSE